jgi:hypothetical protein
MLKGMGKFVLTSAWNAAIAQQIQSHLQELEVPELRVSEEILESLNSRFFNHMAYFKFLKGRESGKYETDRELLVADALAIIAVFYPDKDLTIAGKKPPQVLEELTSIVLENWPYLSPSFQANVWQFMVDGVYRMNRIVQRTHFSYGPPAMPLVMPGTSVSGS